MEYFPGLQTLEILQKTHDKLENRLFNPEQFEDQIIFMSMFNDIDGTERNFQKCLSNFENVENYAQRFARGH